MPPIDHSAAASVDRHDPSPLDPMSFEARHIGPDPLELSAILQAQGLTSLEDLAAAAVPSAIRSSTRQVPSMVGEGTWHVIRMVAVLGSPPWSNCWVQTGGLP